MIKRFSRCHIFLSKSQCIYENLALEEWLFRRHILQGNDLILLNNPAVVIGRHQNPWIESNLEYLKNNFISLCRRHSGGGTVYHDQGNLNISIMTAQNHHDRRFNLDLIAHTLNDKLGTQISRNNRDDLLLEPGSRKISGTAARISHGKAYHHFTLLIDICKQRLRQSLRSPYQAMLSTNATRSVSAKAVGCLKEELPNIQIETVENLIINAFIGICNKNFTKTIENISDSAFFGVEDNLKQLLSWEWIFGKSPKFSYRINEDANQETIVENGLVVQSSCPKFGIGNRFSLNTSHEFVCDNLIRPTIEL